MRSTLHNWSEYFEYRPDSGMLIRKVRGIDASGNPAKCDRWNSRFGGKPTGQIKKGGMTTSLFGHRYRVHRIIWEMHHGPIPQGHEIDHINGNPLDNRLENLRLALHHENGRNTKRQSNNTSGIKGVSYIKSAAKWKAAITVFGKHITIGRYQTKGMAAVARAKAAIRYHGEFARLT